MTETHRTFVQGNRFYLTGPFDAEMESAVVAPLRKEIDHQAAKRDGSIELWISSHGGNALVLVQLIELVEYAKRNGVTVRTVVASHAYSCGSMIAVAGTKGERYISRYADHLAHYGSFDGIRKTTPLQIERGAEHWRRWTGLIREHYERYTRIPDLEEKLKDDDLWVPAEQCIKWGMADKLMDELD